MGMRLRGINKYEGLIIYTERLLIKLYTIQLFFR
jgi:hypothetical protein